MCGMPRQPHIRRILETALYCTDLAKTAAFYQQLRAGAVNPAMPEGQWTFGLALLKESRDDGRFAR